MDSLSYKTISLNDKAVERQWFVVDATDQVLGRLASEVARVIKGKHKTGYTPNVNCGDYVIVKNAEKVKLTGQKMNQKEYISHSGFPGGQKRVLAKDMLEKHPERLVEKAVRGMLPKTKLGDQIIKNLTVIVGSEHPHEAQKPQELTF